MFLIRMRQAWRGEVVKPNSDGEPERTPVIANAGDVIEVDRQTMEALCSQRQIADPLTVEEMKQWMRERESEGAGERESEGARERGNKKALKKPAANKMVSESTQKGQA